METYKLAKVKWTEEEFASMGWHDCKIWGFLADIDDFQFSIDLDYIFKWVHPADNEIYFSFWVAPVTMVFESASDVIIDINSGQGDIYIDKLCMEYKGKSPNGKSTRYDFCFDCHEGDLKLTATGYTMFVRNPPMLLNSQAIDFIQRGGISFEIL